MIFSEVFVNLHMNITVIAQCSVDKIPEIRTIPTSLVSLIYVIIPPTPDCVRAKSHKS